MKVREVGEHREHPLEAVEVREVGEHRQYSVEAVVQEVEEEAEHQRPAEVEAWGRRPRSPCRGEGVAA